ncbi:hypothetical protein F383_18099 [Gossypium arboreum]|uniref:Uncharacterized protein n=1 Tax=Gossypium arboreum TaxID=29729 RepID=A0A0B0ME34_GOSAR|nr:hypothetical protein F383_18099 [Gossypium arboreum]
MNNIVASHWSSQGPIEVNVQHQTSNATSVPTPYKNIDIKVGRNHNCCR